MSNRHQGLELLPNHRTSTKYWQTIVVLMVATLIEAEAIASESDDDDLEDAVVAERQYTLSEQQFDQFLSSSRVVERADGRVMVSNAPHFHLETALTGEIELLARACSLSESQKKKLQLAGRGDIDRLSGEMADLRHKYAGVPLSLRQYTEIRTELQALNNRIKSGIFHESSLFHKTLRKALDAQQRVSYQLLVHDRKVNVAESSLQTWSRLKPGIRIRGEVQQRFIDILVDQGRIPQTHSTHSMYIVLFEAARLESQLLPLLNDEEWQAIAAQVQQCQSVKEAMRRSGVWPLPPDDDDDGSDAKKD